ncbi:MAG: hypothetical protein ACFE96_18155, partial [Candidatus Hermodarchaeota archaeon]
MIKSTNSIGPGGGGSASGIAIVGNDLLVAIDCGGVRRLAIPPNSSSRWTVDKLPPGTLQYDSVRALLSTRVDSKNYAFAGTKDGRLYRWDAVLGWKLIWE